MELYIETETSLIEAEEYLPFYPNPVINQLHLELPEQLLIKIYSAVGTLLYEEILNGSVMLDMTTYEEGLYLLELEEFGLTKRFKLIKR